MGVVIVGPSGSGKSTTWQILRAGLNKTGQVVKQYTMNPKAMPRTQVGITINLYMYFNYKSRLLILHQYVCITIQPNLFCIKLVSPTTKPQTTTIFASSVCVTVYSI